MRLITRITAMALAGVSLCALAGQPPNDSARRYRWVDAAGLAHYSDSLSIEALKFGYDVIGPAGMVVRHVPAELTASEREAAREQAARTASRDESVADRARKDRQLLMAYPTEAGFRSAQQARLDSLDESIHTTRINLRSQEQNLAQLLDHAADYGRRDEPVPAVLKTRIEHQRDVVADQRRALKHRHAEKIDAENRATQALEHYRQLRDERKARYGDD